MAEPIPIAMRQRPLPGDSLVCNTLAALTHPEARARMRHLAIGVEALDYSDEQAIAAALMAERPLTSEEQAILDRDDGVHLPWSLAIRRTLTPDWAVQTIETFAVERAAWWLPLWLEWICDGMHNGQPLSWALQELRLLCADLGALRPVWGTP